MKGNWIVTLFFVGATGLGVYGNDGSLMGGMAIATCGWASGLFLGIALMETLFPRR